MLRSRLPKMQLRQTFSYLRAIAIVLAEYLLIRFSSLFFDIVCKYYLELESCHKPVLWLRARISLSLRARVALTIYRKTSVSGSVRSEVYTSLQGNRLWWGHEIASSEALQYQSVPSCTSVLF